MVQNMIILTYTVCIIKMSCKYCTSGQSWMFLADVQYSLENNKTFLPSLNYFCVGMRERNNRE